MEVLLMSIIVALLVVYGFKAYRLYPTYKNSIFQDLMPSFLEYFYRVTIRKDASTSSFLKDKLGTHRMTFTTLQNNDHKITSRFVIILYNKGIALISYLDPKGALSGQTNDKHWFIRREKQTVKIANPKIESDKYAILLKKKYPGLPLTQYVAVGNECDISKIKCDFIVCHNNEIIRHLLEAGTPYVEDGKIIEAFNSANKNA